VFNFIGLIRYLTSPDLLSIPIIEATGSTVDLFLIHSASVIFMGFLLSMVDYLLVSEHVVQLFVKNDSFQYASLGHILLKG